MTRTRHLALRYLAAAALLSLAGSLHAVSWFPYGPDGGDARAFAVDPKDSTHLYLGAANGWIFESHNEGQAWTRLARVDKRDDLVIDNILVDPLDVRHLIVGAWALGGQADGGIFTSQDGGTTWTTNPDMHGQAVLALTSAPSDPKTIVAGTLAGVFRSLDSGGSWTSISPPNDKQLHEVESIAIDPKDAQTIYAGTWHLPWKTTNGGTGWASMSNGIVTDSDVFSIIVDPFNPKVVYLSACSGIYKSEDGGAQFTGGVEHGLNRAQGIPISARRTRVLMQDPSHSERVYAGTTEGLWRTENAGKTWLRMTGPEVIVNDVYVDPHDSKRVLLATDRGGVLSSSDGGDTFHDSSAGFSARQIAAYAADSQQPGTLYVGVVNDKTLGGVFMSSTGGMSWTQMSRGLAGRDVFSLGQAPDGALLAGTGHGIYRLKGEEWVRATADVNSTAGLASHSVARNVPSSLTPKSAPPARPARPSTMARAKPRPVPTKPFDGSVFAFASSGDAMFAASSQGLLRSTTGGTIWKQVEALPGVEWRSLAASKSNVIVANLDTVMLSGDGGNAWEPIKRPAEIAQVMAAAVDGDGTLWLGGREGVYYSSDKGATWQTRPDLYVRNVNNVFYDEHADRILITSNGPATVAFAVQLPTMAVTFWDTGWNLRFVRPVGDHLVAGTMFDGIVVEPRMVDSDKITPH